MNGFPIGCISSPAGAFAILDTFFLECFELLEVLESGLLDLSNGTADDVDVFLGGDAWRGVESDEAAFPLGQVLLDRGQGHLEGHVGALVRQESVQPLGRHEWQSD